MTLLLGAVAARAGAQDPADDPALELFEQRIRPLIEERCLDCHAATERSSGLALDSRAGLLFGGSRGPAIVPGDPEASLLIRAVRRLDASLSMPPDDPLDAEAVEALTSWIADGAPWTGSERKLDFADDTDTRWWSYRSVADPGPPAPADDAAAASEIDRF
ncbi:MAG: hypothetical protein O7B99_04490, partial [Planctomycetota bacterium]|nr:hypothetical protein [Planctomycetota bacterium]